MFEVADSSAVIANALGWETHSLRPREIKRGHTRLDTTRGVIGGKPAVLFAHVQHQNGFDPVSTAALYAYHSNVDWGLVTHPQGVTIFNSHRLVKDDWLTLPTLSWQQVSEKPEVLKGFTPDGIIHGDVEKFAGAQQIRLLKPIDDALVDRLDAWRDEALKYVRAYSDTDAKLQTLFAQMFVLRAVEDRALSDQVPPLSSIVATSETIHAEAWRDLLSLAKQHIGSSLFDVDAVVDIPPHVVAGVIHDLYQPGALPSHETKYDFSWIEADVLGTAYEKYLSTVLQPLPPPPQQDLFRSANHDVARVSVRKQSGTFYTPKFIHDYLAASTIGSVISKKEAGFIPSVIDFACGSGSFLVAAVDYLLPVLREVDAQRPWAKEIIQGGYLAGVDIDPKTVSIARLRLWHRLVEEPDALPLPDLSNVVIEGDGLNVETWGALNKRYDVVLGNPPFLASARVANRDLLESNFSVARGRYDFSSLFVEQALRILTDDGSYGLVVPNRLFINRSASSVRELILEKSLIRTIVDFGATQPFPDASAYVGCLIGENRREQSLPEMIRVVEVQGIEAEFLAALILRAERGDVSLPGAVKSFSARHPSSSQPWMLISALEMRSRIAVEQVALRLENVAGIFQGIRTGANDLFILSGAPSDEHLLELRNGLGDTAIIERELLEPVVYGSEVDRYSTPDEGRFILYTYRSGQAMPEGLLQDKFPMAWKYLLRNRDLLASRSSVTGGTKWYELIRQRDEAWLRQPKLLIRDLAVRTSFACDITGGTFIVGGTAVVPERRDLLLPLAAYLNSAPISNFVRRLTPQFRGNFVKFEPQHLQAIPVLFRLLEDDDLVAHLTLLASQALQANAEMRFTELAAIDDKIDAIVGHELTSAGVPLEN